MKARFIALALFATEIFAVVPSARATFISDVNIDADCIGYTVQVEGNMNLNLTIEYVVNVTCGGKTETINGSKQYQYTRTDNQPVPFEDSFTGSWTPPPCGDVEVDGSVTLINTNTGSVITHLENGVYVRQIRTFSKTLTCPCSCPGTGTPGYWKNHPEAWPVNEIIIGGAPYTRTAAIDKLDTSETGDKTFTMFSALLAAKLNVLMGCDCTIESTEKKISDIILEADSWMAANGPVGSGINGSSDAWKAGEPLAATLDAYNNGLLCAPKRDGNGNLKLKKAAAGLTLGNYPNPFNPNTTIAFTLPEPAHVTLKMYNALGAEVATLADRNYSAGDYAVDWDARGFASGVYFCRIQAGPQSAVRKLYLVK